MTNNEIITDIVEIKKYQKVFEQILQREDIFKKFENIKVTYDGGSKLCKVYWSNKYKFWSTSFPYENANKDIIRYKNWFGITENEPSKSLELVVEINFSLCHGATSGKLVRNKEEIFVTHNGNIGRISKKDIFWENFNGKRFNNNELAFIGELTEKENSKLYENVMDFINEVKRIKEIIKNNGDNDKHKNTQQKNNGNSKNTSLIKKNKNFAPNDNKPKSTSNKKRDNPNKKKDMFSKTIKNAKQYETQIYKNCKNYQKKPIFERVPETKEIWDDIEIFVKSRDDFGKFIRALYKLIFETTKDEDPNNKFENGRPKPIYRLPKNFVKAKTETKQFMDIVDILRHTLGEAHTPSKLKIPEWKTSYPDALYTLVKSKDEPQSSGEFKKLQIEVSKRFESAMKILLEMVKNDLNSPQKP